jgi:hypothetical protein
MDDNTIYRNDEVEHCGEEDVLSSEDGSCETKSDDFTEDTRDDYDVADQEQIGDSDSDVEDIDSESDISDGKVPYELD